MDVDLDVDVDFHITHPVMSISVEMSRHLVQDIQYIRLLLVQLTLCRVRYFLPVTDAMICPSVFSFGQYLQ